MRVKCLVAVLLTSLSVPATSEAQNLTYRLKFTWPAFYERISPTVVSTTVSVGPKDALFQIVDNNVDNGTRMDVVFISVPLKPTEQILAELREAPLQSMTVHSAADLTVVEKRTGNVDTDKIYRVSKTDLPPAFYELESGFDFGTLAVPFRLQVHDGALTAGSALGLYAGYRQRWLGWPSTLLGSVGLAVVPTTPVVAGEQPASVDNTAAVTAAIGLVFEPISQVQLGLITGIDHTGKDRSEYTYEDRIWVTLAIGFGFIRR